MTAIFRIHYIIIFFIILHLPLGMLLAIVYYMNFKEIYKYDKFANSLGIELLEADKKVSTMTMKVGKQHLNGGSYAHGGVLFTLADITMGALANEMKPISVSLQCSIRFLFPAFEGDVLTAKAELLQTHNKLTDCRATIHNANGDLVAVADGIFHLAKKAVFK